MKSLSKRIQTRDREINALKLECIQRKKLLEKQQDSINKGKDPGTFSKVYLHIQIFTTSREIRDNIISHNIKIISEI